MTLLIIYTLFEEITKKSYQTTIKIRGNERNHNDLEANKKNGKVQSNKNNTLTYTGVINQNLCTLKTYNDTR